MNHKGNTFDEAPLNALKFSNILPMSVGGHNTRVPCCIPAVDGDEWQKFLFKSIVYYQKPMTFSVKLLHAASLILSNKSDFNAIFTYDHQFYIRRPTFVFMPVLLFHWRLFSFQATGLRDTRIKLNYLFFRSNMKT